MNLNAIWLCNDCIAFVVAVIFNITFLKTWGYTTQWREAQQYNWHNIKLEDIIAANFDSFYYDDPVVHVRKENGIQIGNKGQDRTLSPTETLSKYV